MQEYSGDDDYPSDAMTPDEVNSLIAKMWLLHITDRSHLDRIYQYVKGESGRPHVPEGASDEVQALAKLSIKNILSLVRDSFAQNLSVVGYRGTDTEENDPAWASWQRNRMDARQSEVHRPTLTYGVGYVTVCPSDVDDLTIWRPRSPRRMLAVYDDVLVDAWPQYALETWVTDKDAKPWRRGLLYDDTYVYELDLGYLPPNTVTDNYLVLTSQAPITLQGVGSVKRHRGSDGGMPVCPVVRFVNMRDADDLIVGEISPLIELQRAINNVNFDRLIVSRFGAFPQRVITGWQGNKDEILESSASRVWTFGDPDVSATAFPAANVESYTNLLEEMMNHVAMVAQIDPAQVTGKLINLSAEALAAAEKNEQRKLATKRESFGESWEQVLRLDAAISGNESVANDTSAEVVWRDTEARSFGTVVDGITKLASVGVPIAELIETIPGMTQQKAQAIRDKMTAQQMNGILDKLTAAGGQNGGTPNGAPKPIEPVGGNGNSGS